MLGQGAAAFAAALYSARYQLDTIIASESFGGETAIGGLIENYPGTPDIDGFDLMLKFKEQVDKLEVPTISRNLEAVEPDGDRFICTLGGGDIVDAGSVVLCVGRERRTLGLPNEEEWTGKGVSYCSTCDAPLYRNKDAAAVVGGGNAAVEGAILLARYAKHVYLIYRGDNLWRPEPIQLKVLSQIPNVRVLLNTTVTELIGTDLAGLQSIRISRPMDDGETVEVHADQTEPLNRSREDDTARTLSVWMAFSSRPEPTLGWRSQTCWVWISTRNPRGPCRPRAADKYAWHLRGGGSDRRYIAQTDRNGGGSRRCGRAFGLRLRSRG